ncbi:MAG: Asd/ArgC dimerization domain-containing protein [Acidobacteriota bacterium]
MSAELAGAHVILVGPTGHLGAAIRRELVTRRFPVDKITMMAAGEGEEVGQVVEYAGEDRLVAEVDEEQVARADVMFLGRRGPGTRQALGMVTQGRGVAIDLVDVEASSGVVPVVNMDVNRSCLPADRPTKVRAPHGIIQTLSTAVAAAAEGSRVTSVSATILLPASDSGESGVQELYRQTAGVLSFGDKPAEVFERQVAFNAVPHALLHRQQGWPDLDRRMRLETAAILGLSPAAVSVRAVLVPVFHGASLLVGIELDPVPDRAGRRRRWTRARFEMSACTAAELEESDAVHLTDLTDEDGSRVEFWAVVDNLRTGGAANGVRIAEALLAAAPESG